MPAIEARRYPMGEVVPYPDDYARLARQVWPDHSDLELGLEAIDDWLMGARSQAGTLLGYVRYLETSRPHEVHMAELVVDTEQCGRGIGECLVTSMAQHALVELPQRTEISTQPIWGDERADARRRWFNEFGFWMSTANDETNGVWFAPTSRVAQGRHSEAP